MSVTQTGTIYVDPATGEYFVGRDPTVLENGAGQLTVDGGSSLDVAAGNAGAEGVLFVGAAPDWSSETGSVANVFISGAGSTVRVLGDGDASEGARIEIASDGDWGRVEINNGGALELLDPSATPMAGDAGAESVVIGRGQNSNGVLAVDGGTVSIRGGAPELAIGRDGGTGGVFVRNGSTFTMAGITDGDLSALNVNIGQGAGSRGDFALLFGSSGTVSNAGATNMRVGRDAGTALVNLMDAELALAGAMVLLAVGMEGGAGDLRVETGATLTLAGQNVVDLHIGIDGGTGDAFLSGQGSSLVLTAGDADGADIQVQVGGTGFEPASTGAGGTGTLRIADGARFSILDSSTAAIRDPDYAGWDAMVVGRGRGANGAVSVVAAELSISGGAPELMIGRDGGNGSVTLMNDAILSIRSITQNDPDADYPTSEAGIQIGRQGNGTLSLLEGGTATIEAGAGAAAYAIVGCQGGSGKIDIEARAKLELIGTSTRLQIGRQDGDGTVTLINGGSLGLKGTAGAYVAVGLDPGSEGMLRAASSTMLIETSNGASSMEVGLDGGTGRLFLQVASQLQIKAGGAGGSGYLNIGNREGLGILSIEGGSSASISGRTAFLNIGASGGMGFATVNAGTLDIGSASGRDSGITIGCSGAFDGADSGSGRLVLSAGTTVNLHSGTRTNLNVGGGAGSVGALQVLTGSVIDFDPSAGVQGVFRVGSRGAASASAVLDGAGTLLRHVDYAAIGHIPGDSLSVPGGSALLSIRNGARLDLDAGGFLKIGQGGTLQLFGGLNSATVGGKVDMVGGAVIDMRDNQFGSATISGALTVSGSANTIRLDVGAAGNDRLATGDFGTNAGGQLTIALSVLGGHKFTTGEQRVLIALDSAFGIAPNLTVTGQTADFAYYGGFLAANPSQYIVRALNNGGSIGQVGTLDFGTNGPAAVVSYNSVAGNGTIKGGVFGTIGGRAYNIDNFVGTSLNDSIVITGAVARDFTLNGRDGNDVLSGGGGIDTVIGGNGNDTLAGSAGSDTLTGGTGNDRLAGGTGLDRLFGSAGNDIFRFDTAPNTTTNRDTITDFANAAGNNDIIHLENAVFTMLAAGGLTAANFRLGAAAADANDYVIYNKATGILTYDSNGSGAGGAVQIAVLSTRPVLSAADFFVS